MYKNYDRNKFSFQSITKICLPIFLLSLLGCTSLQKTDFSFAEDKLKHLSYSAGISAATAAYYQRERKKDRCTAARLGFAVSIGFGASKETYDQYIKKTGWDWGDVAWDLLGSGVGSLVGSGCH